MDFTSNIDFSISHTTDTVRSVATFRPFVLGYLPLLSVFETSIRYLASMLSAFELSGQKFPALVTKSKQVADKMAFAWVGVCA